MELDVTKNILLDSPPEEIQLSNGCDKGFVARNLELDALPAAKWIKELLAIGLELILVVHIHNKLLTIKDIRSTVGLAIIGDKPVDQT
jgi:hypothetical protein